MQRLLIASLIALTSTLASAQSSAAQVANPPTDSGPVATKHQLLKKYVWSTIGAPGMLSATLVAGFDQWRDKPETWDRDGEGYAKRWVSEYASSAIDDTTKYGVARLFHQDPSFTRCDCTGFAPRLKHALSSPFMARTRRGHRVLSPATVAGIVAGTVIPAATWYPAPRGTADGFAHAGTGVAAKMAVDVVREFVRFHRR